MSRTARERELLRGLSGTPLVINKMLNYFALRHPVLACEGFQPLGGVFSKLNGNGHGTWFSRWFLWQRHIESIIKYYLSLTPDLPKVIQAYDAPAQGGRMLKGPTYKFVREHNPENPFDTKDVVVSVQSHDLQHVIHEVEEFLRSAGFLIEGKLTIKEEEKEDYAGCA